MAPKFKKMAGKIRPNRLSKIPPKFKKMAPKFKKWEKSDWMSTMKPSSVRFLIIFTKFSDMNRT